jgi:hypothetical protein
MADTDIDAFLKDTQAAAASTHWPAPPDRGKRYRDSAADLLRWIGNIPERTFAAANAPGTTGIVSDDPAEQTRLRRAQDARQAQAVLDVGALGLPQATSMALHADEAMAGLFGGTLSRAAPRHTLGKALRDLDAGVSVSDVWRQTGWRRKGDRSLMYEIMNRPGVDWHIHGLTDAAGVAQRVRGIGLAGPHSGSYISFPELERAYPQFQGLKYELVLDPNVRQQGLFSGSAWMLRAAAPTLKELYVAVDHELQHGISFIENFARGASPRDIYSKLRVALQIQRGGGAVITPDEERHLMKIAEDLYKRFAGEVDAVNSTARMHLSPQERSIISPHTTEEVPESRQIFLGQQEQFDPYNIP